MVYMAESAWAQATDMRFTKGDENNRRPTLQRFLDLIKPKGEKSGPGQKKYTPQDVIDMFRGKGMLDK